MTRPTTVVLPAAARASTTASVKLSRRTSPRKPKPSRSTSTSRRNARRRRQYSLVAAHRAEAKHGDVDAAEFYRRALDIAHHVPTVPRIKAGHAWRALGDVLALSGTSTRLAWHISAHGPTPPPRSGASRGARTSPRAPPGEPGGRYDQAVRWYLRGLRSIESLGEKARSEHRLSLSLGYAAARFREGDVVECIEWVERVVD